MKYTEV